MEKLDIMNEFNQLFSGKRVFITGHTGFKGAWLVKILHGFGSVLMGYALQPENKNNLYKEINGDSLCESVISDLRDRTSLKNTILNFQPDYIFHLAAQPLVRLSYEIPAETFEVNGIGTANLLDAVRFLKKKCNIVLITTDKVYHNYEWDYPYRENDRLGGYDPYSASKACCELIIDSYKNSFFNLVNYNIHQKAIGIARAGNVIGGGDWSKDRLIPDIAKALNANKQVVIRNPKAVRPWQHVIEPLFGYLELALKLNLDPFKYSQAYNFGPISSDTLSVEEMVIKSINYWGSGAYKIDNNFNQLHEAGVLQLDISKALSQINWRPIFNAESSIERTIHWYKKYYNGISAFELMTIDIEYYLKHKFLS